MDRSSGKAPNYYGHCGCCWACCMLLLGMLHAVAGHAACCCYAVTSHHANTLDMMQAMLATVLKNGWWVAVDAVHFAER